MEVKAVVMTEDPFMMCCGETQGMYKIAQSELKRWAGNMVGLPVTLGYSGRVVGRVVDGRFSQGKLSVIADIEAFDVKNMSMSVGWVAEVLGDDGKNNTVCSKGRPVCCAVDDFGTFCSNEQLGTLEVK